MVYWAAGLIFLFYCLNVPFRFAVAIDIGEKNRIKIGVGVFTANFFYRRAIPVTVDALIKAREERDAKKQEKKQVPFRALIAALKELIHRADFSHFRCLLVFGTGDAARTAMLYGAATALLHALSAILRESNGFRAEVRPDFKQTGLHIAAGGMVTLKTGHIMLAGLRFLRTMSKNRDSEGNIWSSIPLKTS